MTPQQLNDRYREHVKTMLPRQTQMMRDLLYGGEPEKLSEVIWNHGTVFAEYGLLDWNEAPRVNRVFVALFRNREFERYAIEWGELVRGDQRAYDTIWTMTFKPETVAEADFTYVYDKYMSGTFWNRGLSILLADPAFTAAMEIPHHTTVDEFKKNIDGFASTAGDYDEFQRNARQFSYFGPITGICAGTVCVWAIAVAFTFAFTTGTVTCTAGSTVVPGVDSMLPGQTGPLQNRIVNRSSRVAWAVVRGHTAYRRVPIGPGCDSLDLGLRQIEGVLVGGDGNDVATVRHGDRTYQHGTCPLEQPEDDVVVATLTDEGRGIYMSSQREPRSEQAAAVRPVRHLPAEGAIASWVPTPLEALDMETCSAVIPASMETDRVFNLLATESRHDKMLKLALVISHRRAQFA